MGMFDKLKSLFNKKDSSEKSEYFTDEISTKKYDLGLTKTRTNFVSNLVNLTNKYHKVTEDYLSELEEILIMADLGVNTVIKFMDRLRERIKKEHITNTDDLKEIIVDELFVIYVNGDVISDKINYSKDGPTVILFVGVNGVGKTTSIAKIAYQEQKKGKKVFAIGADTFRAGAVMQLKEWTEKVGCGFYGDVNLKDPASVVYDGMRIAKENKYDIILIDTAGRLQNKANLMGELSKINKVIGEFIPNAPHDTLLVIDSSTGQNGINQAKAFKEITNITGLVLTKMDGTAKGGIVLAIKDETGLPVKYIGFGEKIDDMSPFDIEKYIYGLFKDMIK